MTDAPTFEGRLYSDDLPEALGGRWVRRAEYDALAAELAAAQTSRVALANGVIEAEARIRELTAALREARRWMHECTDNRQIDALLTTSETPLSKRCEVCNQTKELHPNTHPWMAERPNFNIPPWHLRWRAPGCRCDGCRRITAEREAK